MSEIRGPEHLGWRISALLDGELTTVEEDLALEHLGSCEQCQEELAEITAARELVRSLGDAEPPDDYDATQLVGGRSGHLGIVGLVTLAAAWVIILAVGLGLSLPDVTPSVDEFADQHRTVSSIADESERLPDAADGFEQFTAGELDELSSPFAAPPSLDPALDRLAAYGSDDIVQLFYSDGSVAVSIFEQEGTLDWDALPDGGAETRVGDDRAWVLTDGDPPQTVLVVPKGSVIYTLVSTLPTEDLVALADELPPGEEYSLSQRARRNFAEIARRLGLGTTTAGAEPRD